MASFAKNIQTLIRNPNVRAAYFRWAKARLRRDLPLISLPGGAVATATTKFNDFYGIYNQHTTDAEFNSYQRLLNGGGVFVDVGANMGLTSLLAAKTGFAARILAFEPTHRYAEAFHRNMALNAVDNATLMQCAAADVCGTVDFVINPNAPLHNRINLGATLSRYAPQRDDRTHTQTVTTMTLDAAMRTCGVERIKLLKIDVEGAEPSVVRGAANLLQNRAIDGMMLEFIPEFMEEMGESVECYVDSILSFGYCFRAIDAAGGFDRPLTREDLLRRRFEGLNVVALLDGGEDGKR